MGTTKASLKKQNAALNASERRAVRKHGKKTVEEAFEWASRRLRNNPRGLRLLLNLADPYEEMVEAYLLAHGFDVDPLLDPQGWLRQAELRRLQVA